MSAQRFTVFGSTSADASDVDTSDASSSHKLALLYETSADKATYTAITTEKVAETVEMANGDVLRDLSPFDRLEKVKELVKAYNEANQNEITSAYKLLAQNLGDVSCLTKYSPEVVQKASAIYKIFSECKLDTEVSKMFAECGGDLDLFHALLQTNLEKFIRSAVFTPEFVSKKNADKHLQTPGILKTLISSFKAIGVVMTWEKKDDCFTINLKYCKTKFEFKEILALASRGSSVVINLSTNTVTSITRVKFFRPDEINKQYGISSDDYAKLFEIRGYKSVFAIKWDGTNMRIWYDAKTQKYRAATLGVRLNNGDETTTGKQLMPDEMSTYEEKALDLLMKTHLKLQKFLQTNPGMCVICELICRGTVVITLYLEESLQILYFQDESGKVFLNDEALVFESNAECLKFMSENPELCGTIVEGTVQYIQTGSNYFPSLKHKTTEYCTAKHNAKHTSNITGFSLQNPQKRLQAILDIFAEICSTSITAVQKKYETSPLRDFVFECCEQFPKMIAEIQAQISEPIIPENVSPFMKAFVEKLTQLKVADNNITDLDCIYLILGSSDKADAFLTYTNLMTFVQSLSSESLTRADISQLDELIKAKKFEQLFKTRAISLCSGKARSVNSATGSISISNYLNSPKTAQNISFGDFYQCYYNVNSKMVKSKAPENDLLKQTIVSSACLEGLKKPQKKSDTSEPSAILAPAKVSVRQKIVVFDLDDTLASSLEIKTLAATGNKPALYALLDDPNSIQSSEPHQTMIPVVQGLKKQGDRIMILTGRKEHLKSEIRTWILTHFGFDVPEEDIICRKADTKVSTAVFKAQYLAVFSSDNPDASIVFIDDAKENLAAVEKLCPRVNLLLAKEGIMYPYAGCSFGSSKKNAKQHTIVCLCGPPGSGKTTLVKQLIAAGFMTVEQWISHDKEVLKGKDPKSAYEDMQSNLWKSVAEYEVTVLDTTCPDVSQLKKKFPGVNIVVVYTFSSVKLHTDKTMKKQQLDVRNGPYNEALNSFVDNVKNRSLSSEPKTSTLVYEDTKKTLTVVKQIFDKCLGFRERNTIPSITACIGRSEIGKVIEELRTTIGIQTQESASLASASPVSASPASASPVFSYTPQKGIYTGAFFPQETFDILLRECKIDDSDISKSPIGNSHITFAYMPKETDLSYIGTEVEFKLGQPISENGVTMIPVRFFGDHPPVASGNPHITWFVGEGKRASDAGSIKVPTDHLFLDTVYTGIVMLNILGN